MTPQEIEQAIQELREALLENLEASQKEDQAKLFKIKAYKRLVLAKEAINSIRP